MTIERTEHPVQATIQYFSYWTIRLPLFEIVRESLKSASGPHYILHERSTEYPIYVNKEESKLAVQTQVYLWPTNSYMFRLCTSFIRLNTEP